MVGYEIIPSSGFTSSGECLLSTGCKTGESVHASVVREDQEKNNFEQIVRNWNGSCLDDTSPGSYCYFSHSYMVKPETMTHVLAQCIYEELPVTGAIRNENITGLQFHPECSGPVGLEILRRFLTQ